MKLATLDIDQGLTLQGPISKLDGKYLVSQSTNRIQTTERFSFEIFKDFGVLKMMEISMMFFVEQRYPLKMESFILYLLRGAGPAGNVVIPFQAKGT